MITIYKCRDCGASAVTEAAMKRHEATCYPEPEVDPAIDLECEGCS